jgi:NADPH:quinone reductase-like Zn-dependent oxidoreductase
MVCNGLSTTTNVDHRMVQHIPDDMHVNAAAAIQISYVTALRSLRNLKNLQEWESILIHSGAGVFGQAAVP